MTYVRIISIRYTPPCRPPWGRGGGGGKGQGPRRAGCLLSQRGGLRKLDSVGVRVSMIDDDRHDCISNKSCHRACDIQ